MTVSAGFLEHDICMPASSGLITAAKCGQLSSEGNSEQRRVAFIGSRLNA